MSNFRTEMNIPVTRDARTFEQRRKDMLSNLERSYNASTSTTKTERQTGHVTGSDTGSSLNPDSTLGSRSALSSHDKWEQEVNRWVGETRRRWNEDMRRMRQDMFALEPVDDFDLDHWGDFGSLEPMGGDSSSMMARMEREMKSLREQMGSMAPFDSSKMMGGGRKMESSSTSRVVKSSSSTSSGDPSRGMVTKSNIEESVEQSRTVNGVRTGTSSHSSVSKTSTGAEAASIKADTPGTLISQNSVSGGMMDFLKDAYEIGEDGQVHFKVRFDAKDFAPEDIEVTTVDNRLRVHAKKKIQTAGGSTFKEFCRTIDLPRSIDHDRFQCHLTDDGVLILDTPVKGTDYQSITFSDDHQLGIKPTSQSTMKQTASKTSKTQTLRLLGSSGPTILKDGASGRKLHLEVPIEPDYNADDLCVRVDANRIIINGKHEGAISKSFTRSYEIPETVDPLSVTAQLNNTTLIIEAPLLCSV